MSGLPSGDLAGWRWGVDLSASQGLVGADQLAALDGAGCSFVVAKATDGARSVDPRWESTVLAHCDCGSDALLLGAYFVFEPSADPDAQAEHFVEVLGDAPIDLVPWLDFELARGLSADDAVRHARRLAEGVEQRRGRRVGVYAGPAFIEQLERLAGTPGHPSLVEVSKLAEGRPLWVADYGRLAGGADPRTGARPRVPPPWTSASLWQASGEGGARLPWAPRREVDVDWFEGEACELAALLADV